MKLSELFDDDANFRSEAEIKEWITESKNYQQEDTSKAEFLKFFSTSKQRTYLVATPKRLYCILDDSRRDSPHVNWSISKTEALCEGDLRLPISTRSKSRSTGLVDFGGSHKNWLYTKDLFSSLGIEKAVTGFVVSSMSPEPDEN